MRRLIALFCTQYLPDSTQVGRGVVSLEKVVPSVQVTVLLPLSKNPSSHDTVSTVPVYTGNSVSVLRLFQASPRFVHFAEIFLLYNKKNHKRDISVLKSI